MEDKSLFNDFYQRQITLREVGKTGQEKLEKAKVLVVGCGGLGNFVAINLAASGIGKLHLIDFDTVSISNLHRQTYFTQKNIGINKAKALADHISLLNPLIEVTTSTDAISKQNAFDTVKDFDIIVDCTDSLPIKYLLNDICVLNDKILVYGSLYKYDGYVASFNLPKENEERTANLRDIFPDIPENTIPNCEEAGTLNPIVGFIGMLQANEVLKILLEIGKPLENCLLIYNALSNSQQKIKCSHTFTKGKIRSAFEQEKYAIETCELNEEQTKISAKELKEQLENPSFIKISVMSDEETEIPFEVNERIPLYDFPDWLEETDLDENKTYILVCGTGITSYGALMLFKEKFPEMKVLSLEGGIEAYEI
ncbi:HesA/MoeB/ThiF family protein [Aureivirga sp. CE67]|uniref:HesA/MoeB/ThiF family protein n=1 Tax=Aureivirga sp. CE67 TaxID=1788983 RepID=UPI0018CB7B72|nr:HesA/MoeB/ThiF family protein [Aureivirga sp. CE67]